ncbi:MAG: tRNA (adenosine(37)-N6)-threonylcarbamoyltransferase complex dimerization subunit type 1 TsaB [Nitrospinae bacterium]|nr:tRNA (adenosine(37)-N6)-threonylcarbamoyltransferase complex dimerization subunit type 1 TsaB [Nitrospinota bacterium]
MHILAIDTSTKSASAALAVDGEIKAVIEDKRGLSHSRNVLALARAILDENQLQLEDVDCFAVSSGPGSFTGLRIGLSTAVGLADVTGKPVVGVGTLEALARSCRGSAEAGMVVPLLNARKGEVYAAFFSSTGQRLAEDVAIEPEKLARSIHGPAQFIGDGFEPYAEIFNEALDGPVLWTSWPAHPLAVPVALIAGEQLIAGVAKDNRPVLKYVGRSQAELNWEKLHIN